MSARCISAGKTSSEVENEFSNAVLARQHLLSNYVHWAAYIITASFTQSFSEA